MVPGTALAGGMLRPRATATFTGTGNGNTHNAFVEASTVRHTDHLPQGSRHRAADA